MELKSNQKMALPQGKSSDSSFSMDSCRVCMAHKLNTSITFEEIFNNSICDKLQFCTGLQVQKSDGLPTQICTACLENLHSAHKFKTVCVESDRAYRQLLLQSKVKKEVAEEDYESDMPVQDSFEVPIIKAEDCKVSVRDEILEAVLKQSDADKHTKRKGLNISDSPAQDVDLPKARKRRKYTRQEGQTEKSEEPPKPTKYRRLFCELCQIKFSSKKLSDEHKKLVHKETGKSWICEMCGAMFAHQSSHLSHVRCHRAPTFSCQECDYATWHKHDLKKHLQRHTGFKQYQCEFCTAAYYCSSNLKAHIARVHHQVKRFACPLCRKEFFERHKMQRHLDSHNDIKRFSCEVCQSHFSRSSYWRKHMAKQHGVEPPRVKPGRRKTVYSMGQEAVLAAENPFTDPGVTEKGES